MSDLLQTLASLLRTPHLPLSIPSLPPSTISLVAATLGLLHRRPVLLVCRDNDRAAELAEETAWFAALLDPSSPFPTASFPDVQIRPYAETPAFRDLTLRRAATAASLLGPGDLTPPRLVTTSLRAATEPIWSADHLRHHTLTLRVGDRLDLTALAERLVHLGYRREEFVEDPGCFALRGEILDVYSPIYPDPLRLDLFDDTLESLRLFDPEDQRSKKPLASAVIPPCREVIPTLQPQDPLLTERLADPDRFDGIETFRTLLQPSAFLPDLFPQPPLVLLEDPLTLGQDDLRWTQEFEELRGRSEPPFRNIPTTALRRSLAEWTASLPPSDLVLLPPFRSSDNEPDLKPRSLPRYAGDITRLRQDLLDLTASLPRLFVLSPHEATLGKLRDLILDDPSAEPLRDRLVFAVAPVRHGFILQAAGLGLVTDEDIYERRRRPRRTPSSRHDILSFLELKPGDFVVHEDHGIGVFRDLVRIEVEGRRRDFLLLEYRDGDKLYVPLDRINLVQRYIGHEGEPPELSRLGAAGWDAVKARIKESLRRTAQELIRLYAVRHNIEAFACPKDTEWERRFELLFEHPETPDQEEAIRRVKEDMERPVPMDRLVCGDAGFGKTEVAMRAAFKAATAGKQTAVLVPTTVLAEQHLQTFRRRFAPFPFRIEALNRFRTPAERKAILQGLRDGSVDIVIGTHALLRPDIVFRDLGLLVIDEEQKFGVRHKERLKDLRKNVHVLSMSATPIPRTLHFSLAGIRDISVIRTPPADRLPVSTHIMPFDPKTVREAILAELRRGGQVFYIHNDIATIAQTADRLRRLVPEARIEYAHAQMDEDTLEEIMMETYNRRIDVLVATTIVESGLDLPNVNTLFVDDAHTFGLAQLYQLKGRVGRGDRRAYAYLLVPADKPLTDAARKRLETLNECTELGAGIRIALADLEIRGAGNLFGLQQHGDILTVGLDMYLRLMDAAVRELRNEPLDEPVEPHVDFAYDGFIPDAYIPSLEAKIRFYRDIARCRTEEEVDRVEAELTDRFGRMPPELANLFRVRRLKILAAALGIAHLSETPTDWVLRFSRVSRSEDRFVPAILAFLATTDGRARVNMKNTSEILLRKEPGQDPVPTLLAFLKSMTEHVRLAQHPEKETPP